MLVKQITYLAMVTGIQTWQESRHCSLARKIAFMHDAGIKLKGPMEIALFIKGNALNNVMKRLQSTIKHHQAPSMLTKSTGLLYWFMNWESMTSAS